MGCQYFSPTANGADSFTVAMPKLTFGRGCLAEAGPRALTHGMKRVALFTDSFLLEGPYVETVKRSLAGAGLDTVIYADVRIEPCDATVMAAAEFLRGDHFDGVVSVGG